MIYASLHDVETENELKSLLLGIGIGHSLVVIVSLHFSDFASLQHVVEVFIVICSSLQQHNGLFSVSEAKYSD